MGNTALFGLPYPFLTYIYYSQLLLASFHHFGFICCFHNLSCVQCLHKPYIPVTLSYVSQNWTFQYEDTPFFRHFSFSSISFISSHVEALLLKR